MERWLARIRAENEAATFALGATHPPAKISDVRRHAQRRQHGKGKYHEERLRVCGAGKGEFVIKKRAGHT